MSMHSIQELEHGLGAAFRSLIYAKHRHGAQEEEEEEEEGVHLPYVLLKILSLLPLPDLYRMRCTSRIWRHLLSATHMWDALPIGAESRKSCPWILVVDPYHTFNVVHVHDNKRGAVAESPCHRQHCSKKMRGGGGGIVPSSFHISIKPSPLVERCAIDQANISKLSSLKSSLEYGVIKQCLSRHDDGVRPDISVYSSFNPTWSSSSTGTSGSTGTSDYPHKVIMKWSTARPIFNNGHGIWDPRRFLVKYHDAESEACGCVKKHLEEASKPLIPIFPKMAYDNVAQPAAHDSTRSLIGSSGPGIPEIASMIRHDFRRKLLSFHHEELVASCGGLVCFLLKHVKPYNRSYWDGIGHKVLVLNPLTHAFRMLPDLPAHHMSSLLVFYCMDNGPQGYHYRGLRLTMSSTSARSAYFVILHSITIGPMLVYHSEPDSWTFHETYETITTTSLSLIRSKCHVLFKTAEAASNHLSGVDVEAGVRYKLLDPPPMPLELRKQLLTDYYSSVYCHQGRNRSWSRVFIHEGRIIYVCPIVSNIQQQRAYECNTSRQVSRILLQGFGIWELKEDSDERIRFVEISRTPRELWQHVTLQQLVPGLRTIFMHNFCASRGSICGTAMTYVVDRRPRYSLNPFVYSLLSPIAPIVYDLDTNAWTCLPINTPCVALCGVEPSPWAQV